jgi:hypothetical protein
MAAGQRLFTRKPGLNLIKKSKLGDTVPVTTRTLHAKRAPNSAGDDLSLA